MILILVIINQLLTREKKKTFEKLNSRQNSLIGFLGNGGSDTGVDGGDDGR